MRRVLTRTLLAGSGTLLGVIGAAMLTRARAFLEMSGVEIQADPGLLSELKAPSLLLIAAGAFMLMGGARIRFANPALTIGAAVYGGYGLARLIAIVTDGPPPGSLIAASVIELALGGALLALRLSAKPSRAPDPEAPQTA